MALCLNGIGRHDIFYKMGIAFLTPAFCFEAFFGTCFAAFNLRPQSGNAVRVNGFGVQSLETLHFLTSLVLRGWKRCTCQRIWCSVSRNVAPVSGFGVQNKKKKLLADFVLRLSQHCACQQIWHSESANVVRVSEFTVGEFGVARLETLCRLSKDLVFND